MATSVCPSVCLSVYRQHWRLTYVRQRAPLLIMMQQYTSRGGSLSSRLIGAINLFSFRRRETSILSVCYTPWQKRWNHAQTLGTDRYGGFTASETYLKESLRVAWKSLDIRSHDRCQLVRERSNSFLAPDPECRSQWHAGPRPRDSPPHDWSCWNSSTRLQTNITQ